MTPMTSMMPTVAVRTVPRLFPLLGASAAMQSIQADIDSAARTGAKVLLTGETGVGKEVVARTIHQRSDRAGTAFITINCAGVPDSLLESEFFGHARGSFTGAFRDSPGLLRQAHGGTVFLDEVGEMSLRMQALLLRFLETGEIQTVGGTSATQTHVNVRVITATNRNLLECVAAREFREDLYYRLNVFQIHIAPLRDRATDIAMLVDHYVRSFAEQHQRAPLVMPRQTLDLLTAYGWPGNIRELRNVIERLVLRVSTASVEPSALPTEITSYIPAMPQDGSNQTTAVSHKARIDKILQRLRVDREPFWTAAYAAFMARDITRDDMRFIVRTGLEQTQGSYRLLLELFNMRAEDYKRFLGFLKQHDCHLPFQSFRALRATSRDDGNASLPGPGRV
jgi:transcriptional regulator with PAS, ATPase and Fis domain